MFVLILTVTFAPVLASAQSTQTNNNTAAHYQSANGVTGYLGVVRAAIVKGHIAGHPERTMHGGVPSDANEYHVMVAIFDTSTGGRLSDASVTATVFGPGNVLIYKQNHLNPLGSQLLGLVPHRSLEPMETAQAVTYGAYFVLPKSAIYGIQVTVRRPNKHQTAVLNFRYDTSS
jgi:hypothetical protein